MANKKNSTIKQHDDSAINNYLDNYGGGANRTDSQTLNSNLHTDFGFREILICTSFRILRFSMESFVWPERQ